VVNFTSDNESFMNPTNFDGKIGGLAIYLAERSHGQDANTLLQNVESALRAYKPKPAEHPRA